MNSGLAEGGLVFDPTIASEPDSVGAGGSIATAGDYYSSRTDLVAGRADVADVIVIDGALVGELVAEVSNATDSEVRLGLDEWIVDDTLSMPTITNTLTARGIDVDDLVFIPGVGTDLTAAVATTQALPACVAAGAGVGKTLTASVNGVLTIDGVAPALNDTVLVKNQADPIDNGFYTLTVVGTVSVKFELTRSTSMDATGAETTPGKTVTVTAGTVNAGTDWVLCGDRLKFGVNFRRTGFGRYRLKFSYTSGQGQIKSRRLTKSIG